VNIPEGVLIAAIGIVGTIVVWVGKVILNVVNQVLKQQSKTNAAIIDHSADRSPGGTPTMTLAQQVTFMYETVGDNRENIGRLNRRMTDCEARITKIEARQLKP